MVKELGIVLRKMEANKNRLAQSKLLEAERRKSWRWGTAFNIACCAVFAGILLFGLFYALTKNQFFMTAGIAMLIGTAVIVAGTLYAWNIETAQRMLRLMRNMRQAEQARDAAAVAMEEKTRLLATMSHEIRTPLNGVIGMLNLLAQTELNPEQRNYTRTAQTSGRTLLSIIDEILDTSKAEAKHAGDQPTNILELVEAVTELLAPRAHGKGIELSARVSTAVPDELRIDDLKLRQILFNIAGNAIKFTHEGGVRIEVSASGHDLTIVIADTGIGMTGEEQAKLFTAFEQANDMIARSYGGTGLGLVITKRLVEQLGGDISVVSHSGKGTQFTVQLPNVLSQIACPTRRSSLHSRPQQWCQCRTHARQPHGDGRSVPHRRSSRTAKSSRRSARHECRHHR
jgi:signal transduction histidine kinase